MEAFEQFVAVALETEGFVVSSAIKFRAKRQTRKAAYAEVQEHGYEVDLVGARADRLVLATVKSFFGSRGVAAEHVTGGVERRSKGYMLLNDPEIRPAVIRAAADAYGYSEGQVQLRLYVGKFAGAKAGAHEAEIREWCARQCAGVGAIEVFGARQVVERVVTTAADKQYRNNPVIAALKVLRAAGMLRLGDEEVRDERGRRAGHPSHQS